MRLEAELVVDGASRRVAVAAGGIAVVEPPVPARLIGDVRERADRIRLDGERIDRLGAAGRVRAGLAAVSDAPVAGDVSVRDHLAAVTSPSRADRLLAGAPRLAGRGGDMAGVLSGGERLVLAWLRVTALRPGAVVLDGAAAGADDTVLDWMTERVAGWRDDGVAVVVRIGRPEERRWTSD